MKNKEMANNNNDLAKQLRILAREAELERREKFGELRSKQWSGKPSSKQERRKFKQKIQQYLDNPNKYEE